MGTYYVFTSCKKVNIEPITVAASGEEGRNGMAVGGAKRDLRSAMFCFLKRRMYSCCTCVIKLNLKNSHSFSIIMSALCIWQQAMFVSRSEERLLCVSMNEIQ